MPKKTISISYSRKEVEDALRKAYNLPDDALIYFTIGEDSTDYFSQYPGMTVLRSAEVSYESKDS